MSSHKCMKCIHGGVCGDFEGSHSKNCEYFKPENEWVSVKDRLPERPADNRYGKVVRSWYLVALESGCVTVKQFSFDEFLGKSGWEETGTPITHWQPLPEPPTEDNT